MIRVDVVILTRNDGDRLAVAVESVLQRVDVDVAVTVVDNGSIPPALVAAPGVRAIRSETNLGVGGGRNLGVGAGPAQYVSRLAMRRSCRTRTRRRAARSCWRRRSGRCLS
jgi:GT2 family glycosyltransferase